MIKVDTTDTANINITYHNSRECQCCDGKGTQTRYDGIRIICPCCNGTGFRMKTECLPYSPPTGVSYPLWDPWYDV